MAKKKATRRKQERGIDAADLARQTGRFEAATGVAHGPVAIVVALIAALLVVPAQRAIAAIVQSIRGRRG